MPNYVFHLCLEGIPHQYVQDQVYDLSQKICSISFVQHLNE